MIKLWKRLTAWIVHKWQRLKKWLLAFFGAGVIVGGAVIAATVGFSYTPATEYTDGTPMPLSDIDFTRLYCDGALVAEEPGADGDFSVLLGLGSHDCYATHVVEAASTPESAPSNIVTKVVAPIQPGAPVLEP